jgi:hypothetical protein
MNTTQNQYPQRVNHFRDLLGQIGRTKLAATVGGFLLLGGAWTLTINSMSILTPHRYDAATAVQFDQQRQVRTLKLIMAIASLIATGGAYYALRFANERGHWENSGKQLLWKSLMDYGEVLLKPPSDKEMDSLSLTLPGSMPMLAIDSLINCPALIIYGGQGSGKTTLAKGIANRRSESGHQIVVLDPHGSPAHWGGFKLVGAGMKYEQLAIALDNFNKTVKRRYELFEQGETNFEHITFVCDEFTNWATRLPEETASEFLKSSLSDIRKVNIHVIFISHSNTLEILGKSKGLATMRDSGAIQLQLFTLSSSDGTSRPRGDGLITYIGQEPQAVQIPQLSDRPLLPAPALPDTDVDEAAIARESFERLYLDKTVVDHPKEVDEAMVEKLYFWLQGKGVSHFKDGVINARIIRRNWWVANNQKLDANYINQLLDVLVNDGFGYWLNKAQGDFSLKPVDDTGETP